MQDNQDDPNHNYSAFHDGKLLGIIVSQARTCVLLTADQKGHHYRIVLSGVIRLRADEFKEGNTILNINVRSGEQVNSGEITRLCDADEQGVSGSFVSNILSRIHSRQLFLFAINPSYGCEFTCVCERLAIEPTNPVHDEFGPRVSDSN